MIFCGKLLKAVVQLDHKQFVLTTHIEMLGQRSFNNLRFGTAQEVAEIEAVSLSLGVGEHWHTHTKQRRFSVCQR